MPPKLSHMDRPRLYIDFNEMLEPDLCLLARSDFKTDSSGANIALHAGLLVHVYTDDTDEDGSVDNLIAEGTVEPLPADAPEWSRGAKWCLRIDLPTLRHESESRS